LAFCYQDRKFFRKNNVKIRNKPKGKLKSVHPTKKNNGTTLTEQEVLDIRKKYSPGKNTMQQLADEYSIGIHAVSNIIKRLTWRHI